MAKALRYVGLDVGGKSMKAAVVNDDGKPLTKKPATNETKPEDGQEAGLETMCRTIREAVAAANLEMSDIAAIGVATPGLMDIPGGLILDPPNLHPWKNVPVRKHIEDAFGMKGKVAFQNDANAAALGEFWVGAGRGAKSMVLFTLGTGIGGGVILDGKVVEGKHSHGGELGHMRIDMPDRGRLCGCGARGCLEAYAGEVNIIRRAREEMAGSPADSGLRKYYTLDDNQFTAKVIFDLAAAGDAMAMKVADDTAYYLALGACAVIAAVDPEKFVYGGGVSAAGEWFRAKIEGYVKRFGLPYPTKSVNIALAENLGDAGFIGAAWCAKAIAA